MMKRITLTVFSILFCACGGGSTDAIYGPATSASPIATSTGSLNDNASLDSRVKYWEPLVRSQEYTGQIAVMFKESAGVRFGAGVNAFRSKTQTNIKTLNDLFAQHPDVQIQLGLPDIDQELLDANIQIIRTTKNYPLTDWASYYMITVQDADEALQMLSGLYQNETLWFAHPVPNSYPTGIQVPNINPGQDYLKDPASTNGINVKAAWDAGLDGTGIILRDREGNWNVNHLDLPLSNSSFVSKIDPNADPAGFAISQNSDFIQHGTAVAGVIAGKNNGIGITGAAPNATMQLSQVYGDGGGLSDLIKNQAKYADGIPGSKSLKPGDILVVEIQWPFLKKSTEKCASTYSNPSNGCLPDEASYATFLAYKDLTNLGGVVIIEGAGNGGLSLDDPANQGADTCGLVCGQTDFSKGDNSGAIMVGAGMGNAANHQMQMAPYTNCGSRVDVFAWGYGVVTAGYGDHPLSVKSDPNQWYTQQFAGTSSATAIVAGAAALLQQYTKQLYTNPTSSCVIKKWEYAYLSSQQMRNVLVASGSDPKPYAADAALWNGYVDPNPGCNIGKQPDVAKAMQIIKDGCDGKPSGIKATVLTKDLTDNCPKATLTNPKPKQAAWCPSYGATQSPIAKMMDLDGDGRADMISFSRDRKWYVDLSSVGPTAFDGAVATPGKSKDNFGSWNLVFDLSKDASIPKDAMLFPVVMDYNTDGKADLGLYDSVHGKWYVTFTTGNLLVTTNAVGGVNPWPGWDMTLDYSTQPHWKPYSRPVPGDYPLPGQSVSQDSDPYTKDHYMDLAIQTPDGWWLIDFGGENPKSNYGSFDDSEQIIQNGSFKYKVWNGLQKVDKQIDGVPGWAFLPMNYLASYDNTAQLYSEITIKAPDDLPVVDQVNLIFSGNLTKGMGISGDEFTYPNGQQYAGNDSVMTQGKFVTTNYADIGLKFQATDSIGFWQIGTNASWTDLIYLDPFIDFGDIRCRPVTGDFDGDGYDDRAVQCDNVWRIAYSGNTYEKNSNKNVNITMPDGSKQTVSENFRIITEPTTQDPLPGYVYPGGVSFKDVQDIFSTVSYLCPTISGNGSPPPCTLLTMTPAPIGPYFPQCVDAIRKQYATDVCTNPNKQVDCETMHIKQSQCVWQ